MNPVLAKALAHATARLQIGWPLLVVALALYAPADGITRLVLLAAGTVALIKAPTLPAQTKNRRPAPANQTLRKKGDPR
ncbi:hypothetical protein [Kitasatospora terrestris]|uniref:DUF3099 domain-containing protein n=1 Tax=Kitasatospora terrestris TaxID=258051 RepID=A0ABP9E702_9ACTN